MVDNPSASYIITPLLSGLASKIGSQIEPGITVAQFGEDNFLFTGDVRMRKIALGALALFVLSFTLPLVAQDDGARPAPNVLQIYREMVKPGRTAAHEKVEMGWPRAFRASKNPSYYIGMTSLTGPAEAWFVAGYPSYEAWEKESKAQAEDATLTAETNRLSAVDGELLENVRSITAHYRDDMSHRPAINIGAYRYINVVTVRVRPGNVSKFVEIRKIIKAAHEKAGMKDYYSVFEVQSGLPGPSFLIFIPMKSLKEADEAGPLHSSAAYKEALGGDEGEKKLAELAAASIIGNESAIFAFNPKMSNAPAEYAKADPAFWNPKPTTAATPKAKTTGAAKKP
jgi:hypothetical protein